MYLFTESVFTGSHFARCRWIGIRLLIGGMFVLGGTSGAIAQRILRGKVLDRQSGQPLAYANIGIRGTPVGTLSDADGSYSLPVAEVFERDTLVFSFLGYAPRSIPVMSLTDPSIVYLSQQVTSLPEATVTARPAPLTRLQLGNGQGNTGWLENDSIYAGAAIALLIELPDQWLAWPYQLTKARVRIWKNTFPSFKLRLRLYRVDSLTGMPAADLLGRSILLTSTVRRGWVEVDLTPYAISLSERRLFVGFEWIATPDDRRWISRQYQAYKTAHPDRKKVDSVLVGGKRLAQERWDYHGFLAGTALEVSYGNAHTGERFECYSRKSSFDDWKRAAGILTAQITITNRSFTSKGKGAPVPVSSAVKASERISFSPTGDRARQAEAMLDLFQRQTLIPGYQLSVSVKGRTVFAKAAGLADVEKRLPVTGRTQFRVGSVSKALTSAAVLVLAAQGRLDLDAPVQRYVPSFPVKAWPVSTRQLAGHLAGIRHYRPGQDSIGEQDSVGRLDSGAARDFVRTEHYRTATQALVVFRDDSLLFRPGTRYHYSSYGWNLIGAVIEGASGQPFLDYMQKAVWKPLGMADTYGDRADSLMPNRSGFYLESGRAAPNEDLSYKYPGGGLLSTADDLVRYGNALLSASMPDGSMDSLPVLGSASVLDPSLVSLLFTPQATADRRPTGYGMGWNVGVDRFGRRIYWHDGDLLGASAFLVLYPDQQVVIAFLANAPQGITLDYQAVGDIFCR